MAISYQAALRILAKEKGGFTVPKKGSADYEKVRKLMAETEMSAEHETKKRVSKKKPKVVMPDASTMESASKEAKEKEEMKKEKDRVKQVKRIRGKKELVASVALPASMKDVTPPIDAPQAEQMKQKKVRNAMKKVTGESKGGVKRSGETKPEEVKDFLVNNNTGPSALITTQLAGQKRRIKEVLDEKSDAGMIVDPTPEEATIDAMNKEAAKVPALEGRTQFDFITFRRKLLC
jgi:ribonuclease D